tara:strand:+ start:2848 stop:3120 length:273 start_codon:yes stop_codon:yes gene_type:complete
MIALILQADTIERVLNIESISVIGLLLAICGLLIYDKMKKEKTYLALQDKLTDEQNENKKILIELVSKSILATEQNTTAINTLRDVYKQS